MTVKRFQIYPLTIVADRYSGTYSGAIFTVWNEDYHNLPHEIDGSDVDCMRFWDDFQKVKMSNSYGDKLICGKGQTIEDAYSNFLVQYIELHNI